MPVNVAAVSYLNTIPFLYGLKQSVVAEEINLTLVPPAQCAELLETGAVAMALTPVAALPGLPRYHLTGNYCIGAGGPVRTVVLLANTPVENIQTVYLDAHSRTSVMLVRILAKHYWKIAPGFRPFSADVLPLKEGEGCLLIGDKVFAHEQDFRYRYDLAEAWLAFAGQPFVFAVWASTAPQDTAFLERFNAALEYGVTHIAEAIATEAGGFDKATATDYLTTNIDYAFDRRKQSGLQTFLEYLTREKLSV